MHHDTTRNHPLSMAQMLPRAERRAPLPKRYAQATLSMYPGRFPTVDGEVVTGGIIAQTEAVMEKYHRVLKLADCGLEHVVQVGVWLDDPRDFTSFNSVFAKYFRRTRPHARQSKVHSWSTQRLKWM